MKSQLAPASGRALSSRSRPEAGVKWVSLALLLIAFPAPAQEPLRTAGDRLVDVRHIRLDLNVDLPKKTIDAVATLDVTPTRRLTSFALDAVGFEILKVEAGEQKLGFSHDGKKLTIDCDPPWSPDRERKLIITYRVKEPKEGLHFFGPTPAEPDVPLTVWSQGEPVSNRYWFPCLDHPDERQTTELVVTVPEGFDVLSNGQLVDKKVNDKLATFHWRQTEPHVSYLVTLVVGQFDIVEEDWNKKQVLYYVPKGKKNLAAGTFGRTREMLDLFSRKFGIDYPWEKYAQVVVEQYIHGGMENTSATTLTDWALHDERALLDSSPDGLIAHELGHQWWGDMVTCRDWAHLWLNEGFATYCEAIWDEHQKGPDEYAYTMWQKSRGALDGGKDRPIVDRRYPAAWNMFDARAYPKGGFVLHMLRQRLGDETFWKGIQRYGKEHKFQTVETSDLRRTLEKESGRNLERFFHDWTERPGHPVLEVHSEYVPENKLVRVKVKQTQQGEAFHFPLAVVVSARPDSEPQVFEQEVTEKEQTFYMPFPVRPALIQIDPEQAVLAEVTEHKGRELWAMQLQHGSVVSRIRAARHFGRVREGFERDALATALVKEKFWGVQAEIAAALGESGGDSCRDALLRGLKSENPKVRRACVDQLGKWRRDEKVTAAVRDLLKKGDASYYVESAALTAYAKLDPPDAVAVLLPHLAKESHYDVIRTAVLNGLGDAQDLSALDTLLEWAKRGKPRTCRTAALDSLKKLALKGNPNDEQRRQVVAAAAACLDGENAAVKRTAVEVLRDLGGVAAPTLSELEALSRHDPNDQVRDLAKKATEQIRSHQPAPVELARLREELDKLKRDNEQLQDRLNRFEKTERKGP